jgi:CubicO group peptidase (beta-lactamase class C family)
MHRKLSQSFLSSLLLFLFVTGLVPHAAFAQTAGSATAPATGSTYAAALAKIEEKTEARRKELGIPGMSLVIVKDGEIIYMKGLGYKDFEKQVPVTPDTQFAIGSATKAFTALTALIAQDEGKLSLDDHPNKFLPYFKMSDPDTDKNITIRDLLDHSSGLNRTDLAMLTGKLNRAELIQVATQAKPTAKLREKFQYQNLMYTAAGEIVATVEKKPYEQVVPEKIFKPLGMKNSTMTIGQMEKAKDVSFGYSYNFDTKETSKLPYREITEVAPAGSINSSARDMAQWLKFVLAGGSIDGKRIVSEKGFEEWIKPQMKITPNGKSSYGLGWFIQDWNGLKVVQHGGNIDGFNSLVAMIPEKKLGFVMLTNVSGSPLGGDLMSAVWSNMLPEIKAIEAAKPTNAVAAAVGAKELVGEYTPPAGDAKVEIKETDGKVTFNLPGQPPYALGEKAKDIYSLSPLPEGYTLKAKRDAAGKLVSVVVVQPEGEFEFKRKGTAAEKAAITVDELWQKSVDATGGEANWRKFNTRVVEAEVDMENQGVKATAVSYSKAPFFSATETTMTALGKKIATGWEYFDGTAGQEAYSFAPVEKLAGKRLEDTRLGSDFYGPLNWKANYKKIEVTGTAKVGDEDAYIVSFESEKGTAFKEYYSTKTFLLLKREGVVPSSTSQAQLPYTTTYSNYRDVDGVKFPFKTVSVTPSNGTVVTTLKSVKNNAPVDDKIFTARKLQ